jgi:hypothetical protein
LPLKVIAINNNICASWLDLLCLVSPSQSLGSTGKPILWMRK